VTGALFVSDLHLDASRPAATTAFLALLRGEARAAGRLYILGDLFEFWIGDDADDDLAMAVTDAIASYTAAGHACALMRGNRDFLFGAGIVRRTGARLLDDPTVETLCGEQVLLTHGDRLCTDDRAYQRHRQRINKPLVQRTFLALPRRWRRAIGEAGRRRSQAHTAATTPQVLDVNPAAVAAEMSRYGVRFLVHGHTHRPAIHRFDLDGRPAVRIVLGDWYRQGSALRWHADGRYELIAVPLS
jgi:UDP-2,3-diacylglucosamine hydrolase